MKLHTQGCEHMLVTYIDKTIEYRAQLIIMY